MNTQTITPGTPGQTGLVRHPADLETGAERVKTPGITALQQFIIYTLMLYICASGLARAGEFIMSQEAIAQIGEAHDDGARRRVDDWQQLMRSGQQSSEMEKLYRVNDFFNQLEFVNDSEHWGKEDYWATPLQMLVSNGGDCEDFSIAKYFTLLEMGIPPKHLRLTYVKALRLNQAHMVLAYSPAPGADPLILDNLDPLIRPATKRNDLLPVYSFNGNGLWLAKTRSGSSTRVGKSSRLSPWRDVIARINSEFIH